MMRLALFLIGLSTAGCGGGQAERARVETLERRLGVLDEAFAAQEQRIEQLRDRLALLEDRQESSQLQLVPRPLPVVRLRPERGGEFLAERPGAAGAQGEEALIEAPVDGRPAVTITQADLDALSAPYAGAEGGRRLPRQPVEPPENAALAGNIGVVPLQPARRLPEGAPRPLAEGALAGRPQVDRSPAERSSDDEAIAAYKGAHGLYRANSAQAEAALAEFVVRFTKHEYADNALFWIGQIQLNEGRNAAALATFRRVVTEYPAGNKVPDALLGIGLVQQKLGQGAEGQETLARVRAMYPNTEAGRKADALLQPRSM